MLERGNGESGERREGRHQFLLTHSTEQGVYSLAVHSSRERNNYLKVEKGGEGGDRVWLMRRGRVTECG